MLYEQFTQLFIQHFTVFIAKLLQARKKKVEYEKRMLKYIVNLNTMQLILKTKRMKILYINLNTMQLSLNLVSKHKE